jgi:hypothetical protein
MGDSDAQTGITRRVVFGAGQMVRAVQSPLEATGPLRRDRPDGTEDKMRTADSRENLVDETGTEGSNPSPSSGESSANLTWGRIRPPCIWGARDAIPHSIRPR